jgi:hypothetical protein
MTLKNGIKFCLTNYHYHFNRRVNNHPLTIHLQQMGKGRGVVSVALVSRDIAVGKVGNGFKCPFFAAEMGRWAIWTWTWQEILMRGSRSDTTGW